MTYDVVATYSQIISLLLFIVLFIGVLAYALWPGNKKRFEKIQQSALDLKDKDNVSRGQS